MLKQSRKGAAALRARIDALCPDREFVLRSGEKTRTLSLSSRAQWGILGVIAATLIGIGGVTASVVRERATLAENNRSIRAAAKLDGDRKPVSRMARELKARQDFIDDLYRTHFGGDDAQAGGDLVGANGDKDAATAKDISLSSEAAPLLRLEQRQRRFALLLTTAVERRADKAAAAIRSFGLDPDALAHNAARAQGGPFVPWTGGDDAMTGELENLADALARMEFLERSLLTIPSGKPTTAPMQSSSYGFRRDPFNHHAAFHAGVDFPGRYGSPIQAAAGGKVSFVGQRQGYGNVVEIEHGNGLMTRYAHLSGFTAHVGEKVQRGERIARMGSTGRSTGTHLHFEVRLRGNPINPRRFLDARKDVLDIQHLAKVRFADLDGMKG